MPRDEIKWTASLITAALSNKFFNRAICMLDNTYWTGDEADLLVITPNRMVVDVEIKISRSDLKADIKKDKWWHQPYGNLYGTPRPAPIQLSHPNNVWKHYYAVPASIWKDELYASIPKNSGVILVHSMHYHRVIRRAKANNSQQPLSDDRIQDIARLVSGTYWRCWNQLDTIIEERKALRKENCELRGQLEALQNTMPQSGLSGASSLVGRAPPSTIAMVAALPNVFQDSGSMRERLLENEGAEKPL